MHHKEYLSLSEPLQTISNIFDWCDRNLMEINISKYKIMTFAYKTEKNDHKSKLINSMAWSHFMDQKPNFNSLVEYIKNKSEMAVVFCSVTMPHPF